MKPGPRELALRAIRKIDTTDIPEASEEWFRKAKLVKPKEAKTMKDTDPTTQLGTPGPLPGAWFDGTGSAPEKPTSKPKAKGGGKTKAKPAKPASKARSGGKKAPKEGKTKRELIRALLVRKAGCTMADILEATGWPSVSVPDQARAAGLRLKKEKVQGEPTRYFGGD